MGLIKLAILGGAGYLAVKKINEHKTNKQCNGRCNRSNQNREMGDYDPSQQGLNEQYYNPSEKNLPQYRDQPNANYDYPNEKGGMQQIEKH
jgi:hypothetical protein